MKKSIIVKMMLIILLLTLFNSILMAAEIKHEFELSAGTLVGETEYEIQGYNPSYGNFRSLLEFPLNVEIFNLSYKNNYRNQPLNIGGIEISYTRNIDDDAGTFKNSDWLELSGIHIKDIYGETKTRADKIEKVDLRIHSGWQPTSYNLYYTLYIGYHRNNYHLIGYDGIQRELTDTSYTTKGEEYILEGEVIKYKALYDIPYLGAGLKSSGDRASITANVFYSRWVKLEDEDQHLLRNLLLEGEGEGNALLVDLNLSYNLDQSKN